MRELIPGNINNYAYGYQDYMGLGEIRVYSPRLPDDEGYMKGWFAGKCSELEGEDRISAKYNSKKSKQYALILTEWNTWRKNHGLEKTKYLPI